MAREIADKCDIKGCTQTRGPSNNWFMQFWSASNNIVIQAFNDEEAEADLRERVQKGEPSKYTFLCGEECVHKFISQNLGSLHGESLHIKSTTYLPPGAEPIVSEQVLVSGPDDDILW